MKLLARLFPYDSAATDGSVIPRRVVEEYLNSDTYKETMDQLTATGGMTHIDRCLPVDGCGNSSDNSGKRPVKNIIGKDDLLILNKNITHAIERIFIENDGWVYGVLKVFDETLMDDDSAQRIKQVKGLIRNGVKLHVSCVITAFWDSNEYAEKIARINGVDITNNEAFKGAGITEVLEDENIEKGGLTAW